MFLNANKLDKGFLHRGKDTVWIKFFHYSLLIFYYNNNDASQSLINSYFNI